MRANHKHWVAPLPGEPDLFEPAFATEPEARPGCKGCGVTHTHMTAETFARVKRIFNEVWPPAAAVDTSREAAARIKPHTARVREAIWLWLKTQGSHGATAGEICTALGLSGSTVRPRLVELRGDAKWGPGLPKRIIRTWGKRLGMRIYIAGVAPRHSGNP